MHRIDTSTAQVDKFGAGKNGFTGGNPQTGELPTALNADFFDSVQEEIAGVIEAAGLDMDKTRNDQLSTALVKLCLSRSNPFADIKKDGSAAVSAALANLGLGDGSALPIGVPVPFPQATPPAGWILCRGQSFTADQYPRLALVYPGLVLPDLRGEFIRGWDDARGADSGREILTSQSATSIRTAALDYFSVDGTTINSTVGTSFAQADTVSTGKPVGAKGPNNTDFASILLDNTMSAQKTVQA